MAGAATVGSGCMEAPLAPRQNAIVADVTGTQNLGMVDHRQCEPSAGAARWGQVARIAEPSARNMVGGSAGRIAAVVAAAATACDDLFVIDEWQ